MQVPVTVGAGDVTTAIDMAVDRVRRDGHHGVRVAHVQQLGGLRWRVLLAVTDPPPPVPGAG